MRTSRRDGDGHVVELRACYSRAFCSVAKAGYSGGGAAVGLEGTGTACEEAVDGVAVGEEGGAR